MGSEKCVFKLECPHGNGDVYISWQRGSGTYLATTGIDQFVAIYNRHGKKVERIRLQGVCTGFGWDSDGDMLAIIAASSPHLTLWDANTGKKSQIDTGLRDPMSCIIWAKSGPHLAVGTARGNLAIYNHNTAKRVPILGKHSKRISCGAWSTENLLALGSEDRTVSVSNIEGDTLRIISVRFDPSDVQFSQMKLDERPSGENTVSMLVGKKTLFLYNLQDPDNPVELAFQHRYGTVVAYKWFGDGYILLGFSAGYFVAISTHIKEVGQELFQVKNHRDNLSDIAICTKLGKVASCGDNMVKIHDMANLQETSGVLTLEEESSVERLAWSEDGQLLAITGRSGSVHVFLSRLPMVSSVQGSQIAVLTSLTEMTLFAFDIENKNKPPPSMILELIVEPSFLALGPYHCAAGMNNHAWYYDLTRQNPANGQPVLLRDREYLGTITSLRLNTDYASALYEGKIQLHMIEPANGDNEDREIKLFPDQNTLELNITCHALTTDFLIYGTDMGHIHYFYIEDWKLVTDFRHEIGLRDLYPDLSGSRLVIVDDKSEGYIYTPASDQLLKIPDFSTKCAGALWDTQIMDRNVFVVFDDSQIFTYIYVKDSVEGTKIELVGTTKLPGGQIPLLLYGGQVVLHTPSGKLMPLSLTTHEVSGSSGHDTHLGSLEQALNKQVTLRRFSEAWKTCQVLNRNESWSLLAEAAMRNLDIEFAIRVYRHIGDVGMVWSLQSIHDIEDQRLLAGHVSMFLKNFEKAQEWYLLSSQPVAALNMRRDLLQWDQALQLASKLAPDQIPYIAREYAQQLEFTGNFSEALGHYERGLLEAPAAVDLESHHIQCRAGVARTAIRCGDIRRGVSIAAEPNSSRQLKKECADILEGIKQLSDAAMLYEKGQYFDKAASTYIRLKNWAKVGELLPNITSPKIHLQYAKAKEADGKYKEAAEAYELARDWDNVVRINLDHLRNPHDAVNIVKETKSIEGAKMVAKYFQRQNDYRSAIHFLVMSQCHDEAFQMARTHAQMELYGEVLSSTLDVEARPDDFRSLALHFENEKNSLLAGKYFYHAGDYHKALKHLMKVLKANSEDSTAISLAIDVVGAANDDHLASQVIDFLLGETDGMLKDAKYLFRLYMARKQYREAAKTAIIIANEEQINGNYRNAHDVLFGMYQELQRNNIKIPTEMQNNLMLLHSYILVRLHVKRGKHILGARMLIRVANNISKFPSHIVPILTSTVIECSRAGLRTAAFTYAAMLMRPEYRSQIDPKYAKKIETVVRRPNRLPDNGMTEDEPETPCPYCSAPVIETELNCAQCKNTLPFCIATGRHIVKEELTSCPNCDFPAIIVEFRLIVEGGDPCPMCSENIDIKNIVRIEDARPYLHPTGED
ncbi:WD repeat-containing protein 19 [Anabrus simplex]|uniref:WD repeat-containing protein 19 n=1 Tax=Anabrus simplex TaxID=316456 RepID=UPI0035A2B120